MMLEMQRRLKNKVREEKLLKVFAGISFEGRLRTVMKGKMQ